MEQAPTVVLGARFADPVGYAATVHARQRRKDTDVPYVAHLLGVEIFLFAKDMRVAPHQLVDNINNGIVYGELSPLGGQLGMEYHLNQQVPQFFTQVPHTARFDSVHNFV